MRIDRLSILAGVCLALAACTTAPKRDALGLPVLSAAEERGRDFAYRRCGGCHNVGRDDVSKEGPPFAKLALRYNSLSLRRRFAEISEHGAETMQPISFSRAEAEDLLAYVSSLADR